MPNVAAEYVKEARALCLAFLDARSVKPAPLRVPWHLRWLLWL